MIVAIHQPNYIPWLGYFDKISKSDIFVFLDHVEFSKNGFINRNKVAVNNSPTWLTVPVPKKYHKSSIMDIHVEDHKWRRKHLKTLQQSYSSFSGNQEYLKAYGQIINSSTSLCEINISLILWCCSVLGIESKFVRSSQLNLSDNTKTDLLVEITQACGAQTYLSGQGASEYLKEDSFGSMQVEWQKFSHPTYKQGSREFIPNLSVLDFILTQNPLSYGI